jgi:hypothetical protein
LKIRVELSFADRTQQHHLDGALRRWYLPTKRHKSGALRQRTLEQWLGVGITASLTSAIRLDFEKALGRDHPKFEPLPGQIRVLKGLGRG